MRMLKPSSDSEAENTEVTIQGKKPYRAPKLFVYGDLSRITHGKGGNKGDGNGNPATKG